MTTTQQRQPTAGVAETRNRGPMLMIGMAVIGLILGLLGGWALFAPESDVIAVQGGELSDRQIEMTEMVDDAFDAWIRNDVDEVLTYYTDTGTFVALGVEYPVADGSLADFVEGFTGASQMESLGPKVVIDSNTILSFHDFGGVTRTNVFDFTSSGDVLIARHAVISGSSSIPGL